MNSYEKYLTILILSIFTFELVLAAREKIKQALVRDMLVNLGIGLTTITIGVFMKGVSYGFFMFVYQVAFIKPDPSPLLWVIGFLGCDFIIYWYHYLGHKTRLFWAAHVTHHSSVHFNISVGFRVSFIHVFYRFLFWSPLCLLGIPPYMILFFDSLTTIDNILIHTGRIKKLGILDLVFNTPSNHRVHHAVNPQYRDKNMGGILIIFDHLFGTYAPEGNACLRHYKNIHSHNPATILLHEYRHIFRQLPQVRGWKEKIKFLFRRLYNTAFHATIFSTPWFGLYEPFHEFLYRLVSPTNRNSQIVLVYNNKQCYVSTTFLHACYYHSGWCGHQPVAYEFKE